MFVTNSVSVDTRVIKEAASLTAAGHSVTVLGLQDGDLPVEDAIEGFAVRRIRRDTLHGREKPGLLHRALGVGKAAWVLLDYSARAFWYAVRGRFDAYHAHDLPTLPAAWAAARLRRARLVYDAHELFPEMGRVPRLMRRTLSALERFLIRRADRVITVNESIATELADRYAVGKPTVLRNCPRAGGQRPSRDASPLRERAGLKGDTPLVLYQGLYRPHRGLENLIRAAALFRRAHLVLMGWGPLLPELQALAGVDGRAGRVTFLEPVPMDELLLATAGADLGVVPYLNVGLNNFYTSPNKLFEYCAAGVPIAASRFPELVKVVEGLGVGVTFDPERPDDIARAVNGLLDDADALARVRANVARVGPDLTWERESQKLTGLYATLPVPA